MRCEKRLHSSDMFAPGCWKKDAVTQRRAIKRLPRRVLGGTRRGEYQLANAPMRKGHSDYIGLRATQPLWRGEKSVVWPREHSTRSNYRLSSARLWLRGAAVRKSPGWFRDSFNFETRHHSVTSMNRYSRVFPVIAATTGAVPSYQRVDVE